MSALGRPYMKRYIPAVYTVMLLCLSCAGGGGTSRTVKTAKTLQRPEWISRGETGTYRKTMFWLGVGTGDTPEQAAQSARQDVSSQIRTHVRSRITDVAQMRDGSVQERFESISQNITDTKLEGLEILERFTGRRRCYALAGLNKSVFLGKISDKVSEAVGKAQSSFSQAKAEKKVGRFSAYYSHLRKALSLINGMKDDEYFYRSFVKGGTDAGNRGFALERETGREINSFLSGVKVEKQGDKQKGSQGKPLGSPLAASFSVFGKPLSGFPVVWKTKRGRVVCDASSRTDAEGMSVCRVTRVEQSPVAAIQVVCSLDTGMPQAGGAEYIRPEAVFSINIDTISKWLVYIQETGNRGVITSCVISDMKSKGVEVHELNLQGTFDQNTFIKQASRKFRDYNLITGSFQVREIDRVMGNSTSRAHGNVKAVQLSSGRILFHETVTNAIGVSHTGDPKESARKALSAAGKKATETVQKQLGF